jgi:gamma-glutamyl-gamma-aminobutyrate hydrolase PuuD
VKTLAAPLRAVAWAEDGVIEAVEWKETTTGWLLAVQWHPEDDVETGLFEGFAGAVQRAATGYAAAGLRS